MGVNLSRVQPIRDLFGLREASLGTMLATLCRAMLTNTQSLEKPRGSSAGESGAEFMRSMFKGGSSQPLGAREANRGADPWVC